MNTRPATGLIGIPIGDSPYIVVKQDKVVRRARACGAIEAREILKPSRGEKLYIEVGQL